MPTGPVNSESVPDGFTHAQTTHMHIYVQIVHQHGLVGTLNIPGSYLKGIQN